LEKTLYRVSTRCRRSWRACWLQPPRPGRHRSNAISWKRGPHEKTANDNYRVLMALNDKVQNETDERKKPAPSWPTDSVEYPPRLTKSASNLTTPFYYSPGSTIWPWKSLAPTMARHSSPAHNWPLAGLTLPERRPTTPGQEDRALVPFDRTKRAQWYRTCFSPRTPQFSG